MEGIGPALVMSPSAGVFGLSNSYWTPLTQTKGLAFRATICRSRKLFFLVTREFLLEQILRLATASPRAVALRKMDSAAATSLGTQMLYRTGAFAQQKESHAHYDGKGHGRHVGQQSAQQPSAYYEEQA